MERNNKCMDSNVAKGKIIKYKKEKYIIMFKISVKKTKKTQIKDGLIVFLRQTNDKTIVEVLLKLDSFILLLKIR